MKISHKKIFYCILALILFTITLCPVVFCAVPQPTADFFVNDYADALSTQAEAEIQSIAVALYNETTAQVCVLTVESLDGEDISEYSVEVFREWGIGDKEKDNGVLIVLSVGDREVWVTTGYGVEGTLTDTRLGQLIDIYAIPHYSNDDFNKGTLYLFNSIVNELRTEEYGLTELENFNEIQSLHADNYYELPPEAAYLVLFVMALPILLALIGIPALIIRYNYLKRYDKLHGTQRTATFVMKMNKIKEIILFIAFFNRRSGRGGGGHHHGGGFGGGGGFRGGGGSTGGGGAGRSF